MKGWTVVNPTREYLNSKKRSCMQDNCSFVGNYKELQKHVRAEHPCAHHGSKSRYQSPTRTILRRIGRVSADTQNKMSKIFKNY